MSKDKVLGDKYKIGDQIAQGGFSTVYYCTDLHTRERFAVKVLSKNRIKQLRMEEAFEREASALRALNYSPYVTNVVDILQSTRNYYVVMDLADGGTLLQIIVKGNMGAMAARKYFRQLLLGLKDIHDSNVVHRDIKPENLLIDSWRDLKISDFGFAACSSPERVLTRQCGTPQYVAPEVFTGNGYRGRPADVWSAGVTLYVMLYRTHPFVGNSTERIFERIRSGRYETPPQPNISPAVLHLLSVMLRQDPAKRWPIERLIMHPWVLGRDTLPSRLAQRLPNACGSPLGSESAAAPHSAERTPLSNLNSSEEHSDSFCFAAAPFPRPGRTSTQDAYRRLRDIHEEATSDFFATMKQSAAAPSISCPDFRSLFNMGGPGQDIFSDPKRRTRAGARHQVQDSYLVAAAQHHRRSPIDRPSPGGRLTRRSPGGSSRTTPHNFAESVNLRAVSTVSSDPGNAPPSRFHYSGSFVRRFGVIHLRIAFNFVCVCTVVLIVGCLRVLFDIDVGKLPLPATLKATIEQLLAPPTTPVSVPSRVRAARVPDTAEVAGAGEVATTPDPTLSASLTSHNASIFGDSTRSSGAGASSTSADSPSTADHHRQQPRADVTRRTPRRRGLAKAASQVFELDEFPLSDLDGETVNEIVEVEKALSDGEAHPQPHMRFRGHSSK